MAMVSNNTFKVLGVHCLLTGTEDYGNGQADICKQCTYIKCCTAKYNEEQLVEAQELYEESLKLEDDAKQLRAKANEIFNQVIKDNDIIKYQWNHYSVSSIWVKESITYPKAKLLKCFTEEQLKPASEIKDSYTYLRIDDLLKPSKWKANNA